SISEEDASKSCTPDEPAGRTCSQDPDAEAMTLPVGEIRLEVLGGFIARSDASQRCHDLRVRMHRQQLREVVLVEPRSREPVRFEMIGDRTCHGATLTWLFSSCARCPRDG